MKLTSSALNWAVRNVAKEGDTDLLPMPFEIGVIKSKWATLRPELAKIDIEQHVWQGPRRLVVPKAEFSFRPVCQLDPIDTILFTALTRVIGAKIEATRIPVSERRVFSYRFVPLSDGTLYSQDSGWEKFWNRSLELSKQCNFVLICDISDYYNQIYHHTIENRMLSCGIQTEYRTAVKKFLANTTEGISRGIPIGPHGAHLLAEMSLIAFDNYLKGQGYSFCRYVDDIHIFADDMTSAHKALYSVVEYLDKTEKLQLNKQKTKILSAEEFAEKCSENVLDNPINEAEANVLVVIKSKVADPYRRAALSSLSTPELSLLSKDKIEAVLNAYLSSDDTDFIRLRWFLRRLTQVGAPGGVEFVVEHFAKLLPVMSDVAQYLDSARSNYSGNWSDIGEKVLILLKSDVVRASEYLRLVLLSLFSRIVDMNHVDSLTAQYDSETPSCQREIVLAAAHGRSADWLRRFKAAYKTADPWLKRAIIYAGRVFPKDEREFWWKSMKARATPLESLMIK